MTVSAAADSSRSHLFAAFDDYSGNGRRFVVEYGVRFTKPVIVPNDDKGALIEVTAKVAAKLEGNQVRVDVTAMSAGQKVLGMSRAVVQLT